jgi:hypothetical protein
MMMMWSAIAYLLMSTAPLPEAPPSPGAHEMLPDELTGFALVPDEQLAQHRGGFAWQGVEIKLGAEIRTYLNGELVLQTNVTWTELGAQTVQTVSGSLTAADAAQLQAGILTSGGITMRVGDQSLFLTNQGQTAILHRTDGAIQNILVNTASNIEASQEIDASLDLGNFGQFQENIADIRLGDAIGDMVGHATIGTLGN